MTAVYALPPVFYYDHVSRDLPAGVVERETKAKVFVRLNQAEYNEMVNDSEFYWSQRDSFERECFGLCTSARATHRALLKQGAPS